MLILLQGAQIGAGGWAPFTFTTGNGAPLSSTPGTRFSTIFPKFNHLRIPHDHILYFAPWDISGMVIFCELLVQPILRCSVFSLHTLMYIFSHVCFLHLQTVIHSLYFSGDGIAPWSFLASTPVGRSPLILETAPHADNVHLQRCFTSIRTVLHGKYHLMEIDAW